MTAQELLLWRLESLGFPPEETDQDVLAYHLDRVSQDLMAWCGVPQLPDELSAPAADRAAAAFLREKKDCGKLLEFPSEPFARSVQVGDTTVSFSESMTPEMRLDALLQKLDQSGEAVVLKYRRLPW